MVKTQKDLKSSSFRCSNTPHKNKKSQCFTLHQVARNWSELFGFGAKIAPTMKHNTCMVRILYFLTTLDVSTMFVTGGWRHPTPQQDYYFLPDTIPGIQGVPHQVWQASLRTCSLWLPLPSWWLTGSTSENIGAENTKRLGCMDRCRPSKHRFAFLQPATLFHLLQIASKETAKLVRKYTRCLKSQKWCNWNTEFPTIIYFMAIQIQFNSNAFNIKNWFLQLLNNSHWFTIWFSLRSPNKFTQRRPGCRDWEMFHTFHHLLDEEGVGVASSL